MVYRKGEAVGLIKCDKTSKQFSVVNREAYGVGWPKYTSHVNITPSVSVALMHGRAIRGFPVVYRSDLKTNQVKARG